MSNRAQVNAFFHKPSETFTYVVFDQLGGHAAVIDPVLDFDYPSAHTSTEGADKLIEFIQQQQLTLMWILETHAHADHLSAATYIRSKLGGKIGISEKITQVQSIFADVFHLGNEFCRDGSQFDYLFKDDEFFSIGNLRAKALATPGHTAADISWIIEDAVFVGDTLFMPDVGTARCDFPGGDAKVLYHSIQRLLDEAYGKRLFMCHDYPKTDRAHQFETSVEAQRKNNIHIHQDVTEEEFVAMRNARDATLGMPRLIIPSIQVNIRAGDMPEAEENGVVYLKVPINRLG